MDISHSRQEKGVDAYAVEAIRRKIGNSGFNTVMIESDQDPPIRKLLEAAKNERAEELNLKRKVEMIPESSPVGEPRANGEVQRYVQTVQGHVRTLKMALETWCKMKIEETHSVLPWLIMYAAMLIKNC